MMAYYNLGRLDPNIQTPRSIRYRRQRRRERDNDSDSSIEDQRWCKNRAVIVNILNTMEDDPESNSSVSTNNFESESPDENDYVLADITENSIQESNSSYDDAIPVDNDRMSFGTRSHESSDEYEVIGALSSVILIWLVTGILLFLAIERTVNTDFELDAPVMLITSVIGVAVNLVMGLTLHHHGHDEHSHQIHHSSDNINKNKHTKSYDSVEDVTTSNIVIQNNINVRAAFIHVLGDFIQSIGVFIAALIIYFEPSWCIVDPICTFLFSILVMFTTISIIKDVMNVLMEGIPRGFDYSEVEKTFMAIEGVIKVHNLRIWALSLDKTALSAHLVISREASPQNILQIATRNIHDRYQFFEMTLQIEEFHQKMEDCKQCKPPSE